MNINRSTNLNGNEVIGEIHVSYSTNYIENSAPTVISMNASYNKPGAESRTYRTYSPDGSYTPEKDPSIAGIFDEDFDASVLVSIMDLFTNYATI